MGSGKKVLFNHIHPSFSLFYTKPVFRYAEFCTRIFGIFLCTSSDYFDKLTNKREFQFLHTPSGKQV